MKKITFTSLIFMFIISSAMGAVSRISSSDENIKGSIKTVKENEKYTFYNCIITRDEEEVCLNLMNQDDTFHTGTIWAKKVREAVKVASSTVANLGTSAAGLAIGTFIKQFGRPVVGFTALEFSSSTLAISQPVAGVFDALNPALHLYSLLVLEIATQDNDTKVNDIREFADVLRELLQEIKE